MNSQFMFTPQFSKYADNARYLKKAFSSKWLFIQIIGTALILVTMIFWAVCIFNYSDYNNLVQSQEEEIVNIMYSVYGGLSMLLRCVFLFLVMLAMIILLVTLRTESSHSVTVSPFILCRIFLVLTGLSAAMNIFSSGVTPLFSIALSKNADIWDYIFDYVLLSCLPSLIVVIWAVFGVIFTFSAARTIRCTDLSCKAGKVFIVFSRILSLIYIALPVVYCIDNFKGGIFSSVDGGSSSVNSVIVHSLPSAQVMIVLYYLLCAAVLFFSSFTVREYVIAVNNAKRSFEQSGSNLYMNSDSAYSDYYSRTYSSPQINNQSVQGFQPPVQSPAQTDYPVYKIPVYKLQNIPPYQQMQPNSYVQQPAQQSHVMNNNNFSGAPQNLQNQSYPPSGNTGK